MEIELWKDIPNYDGLYQISTMGRVRRSKKILKPDKTKDGYLIAQLCRNGKVRKFRINRLVAFAFIPNPENFPQVNHKNECKTDNRVENLEWCNAKHNINSGTCIARRSIKQGKPVICITTGKEYYSIGEASRETGYSLMSISRSCNNGKMINNAVLFSFKKTTPGEPGAAVKIPLGDTIR